MRPGAGSAPGHVLGQSVVFRTRYDVGADQLHGSVDPAGNHLVHRSAICPVPARTRFPNVEVDTPVASAACRSDSRGSMPLSLCPDRTSRALQARWAGAMTHGPRLILPIAAAQRDSTTP